MAVGEGDYTTVNGLSNRGIDSNSPTLDAYLSHRYE